MARSSAAIEGLTRAAAVDHGPDGIRVSAVALDLITTDRHEALLAGNSPTQQSAPARNWRRCILLRRVGRPAEVADTVAFLLPDAASFISGAVLPVD